MPLQFALHPSDDVVSDAERAAALENPGFGRYYPDYLAEAFWTPERGWHEDGVVALHSYALDPGTSVFHYGQEIYEGLKAYQQPDGSVALFRPDLNAERFAASARRIQLPVLDPADFLTSVEAYVRANASWVPAPDGEASLYVRPFMFASEPFLVVRPTHHATYVVVGTPAMPYYGGEVGMHLWVTRQYTRAAPGGTGAAKCGGNYGASVAAQNEAAEHGCDQVLYLDGKEGCWLEEAGTMNLFLVMADGTLHTPALGTILDGVTRRSVLELAPEHGMAPVERRIGYDELAAGIADGSVREVFATGTAAIVSPIVGLRSTEGELTVGDGDVGEKTRRLRRHLLGIQYGTEPDPRGWMRTVC